MAAKEHAMAVSTATPFTRIRTALWSDLIFITGELRFRAKSFLQSAVSDVNLLDESISLPAAIQLSGYPSVIGPLWSVADNHSAEIASHVYSFMLKETGNLESGRAAEGLYQATHALRERSGVVPGFKRPVPYDPDSVYAGTIH